VTPGRQRFEAWLAAYLWRHPILASDVQILPGLRLRECVVAAVEQAREEALRQAALAPAAVQDAEERPDPAPAPTPLHLAPPPAPNRRRSAWTPERRAKMAEICRARVAAGKFGRAKGSGAPRPEEDPEWPG